MNLDFGILDTCISSQDVDWSKTNFGHWHKTLIIHILKCRSIGSRPELNAEIRVRQFWYYDSSVRKIPTVEQVLFIEIILEAGAQTQISGLDWSSTKRVGNSEIVALDEHYIIKSAVEFVMTVTFTVSQANSIFDLQKRCIGIKFV